MSRDREFERFAEEWLEAGTDSTSPEVIDAVLLAVRNTPQERGFRVPWRIQPMRNPLYAAGVIAVVVIAGAATLYALGPGGQFGSDSTPSPTTEQTPTASPTTTGRMDTSGWTTYTSPQYAWTVAYPPDWDVQPAERAWDPETDAADIVSPGMDDFTAPEGDVRVSIWSVPLDPAYEDDSEWGIDLEAWIEDYCANTDNLSCASILDTAVPLCREPRDCHPGILVTPVGREVQAFFSGPDENGVITVVTLWRADGDPSVARYGGGQRLIEGFLETMCVMTEDARASFFGQC
jgi:hypothetical protein